MEILNYTNSKGVTIDINDSYPFHFEDIKNSSELQFKIDTVKNYDQDGVEELGGSFDTRELLITGTVQGENVAELEEFKRKMITIFNPNLVGKLTYTIGNVVKSINCRPSAVPTFENVGLADTKRFTVNLFCSDPFWIDTNETTVNVGSIRKLFKFPTQLTSFKFGEDSVGPVIVNNNGDIDVGIIIRFKSNGTVVNPALTNPLTSEYIKINKTMAQGEIIEINTNKNKKKITSTINGATTDITNLMDYNSTFLQLKTGGNKLQSSAQTNYYMLDAEIIFTPKYLGV